MTKKKIEKICEYETIFDPNGEGYTVTVPKLPGLVTEGENMKEAREMAKDAIRVYLEASLRENFSIDKLLDIKKEKIKIFI